MSNEQRPVGISNARNKRVDVLVVGEVLVELRASEPLYRGQSLQLDVSGDALNAAAAASSAGASVGLLTRVSDAELGDLVIARIAQLGVDTAYVRRVRGEQGVYFVVADPTGARQFVYARKASVASTMVPEDLEGVPSPTVVLASGIACAISPSAAATVERAATLGNAFVFDPNFRPRLTTAEAALTVLRRLAPLATVVTPSAPGDSSPLLGTADPRAAAAACQALGARYVIVTCGADGLLVDDGSIPTVLPAIPAPHLVDQTGAGDVFCGTLAARLSLGDVLDEAVALAAAASSLSLAGAGGTGCIPSLGETRRHLARFRQASDDNPAPRALQSRSLRIQIG